MKEFNAVFRSHPEPQELWSDNREETQEGDLCVALFFPDNTYYIFKAQKVQEGESDEYGEYYTTSDTEIGFIDAAFYWHTFGQVQ